MASEPSDQGSVSISLPPDLEEWILERASERGVETDTVVAEVLAAYRATHELDGETDLDQLADAALDEALVEELVKDIVSDRIDDIAAAVVDVLESEGKLQDDVDVESVREDVHRIESELDDDIARVESNFQEKLDDVRQRVVQVKREADQKAPKDHSHDRLDGLDDLQTRLDEVEASLSDVREDVEGLETTVENRRDLDSFTDRLEDVEEKLRTVAWVVSDLRDAHETQNGTSDTVDAVKRAAARENVERAQCENCGQQVRIGLLTEPNCPHCDATVTDVEPAKGFFGRPRLAVAKQLEAADDDASDAAVER